MANSNSVGKLKRQIIKEFIKDNDIVKAIDSPNITSPEKLINTHIFDFHQNPNTINAVITFITIQVHIPESFYDTNRTYVNPTIEIWIISHVNHMIVDNIPKVKENRNDYISMLIDRKINGHYNLGFGKLELTSNIEGSFQQDYVYRKLTFKGTDLNDSVCKEEEFED